jgi:hypothetical protein
MSLSEEDARRVDEYVRQHFNVAAAGGVPPAATTDPDPDPDIDEDLQLAVHIATRLARRAVEP